MLFFFYLVGVILSGDSPVVFNEYAVNTESPIASEIGKRIIERGGNALDAAISAALAVGVINSFSSGIGGGGFLLIRKKTVDGDIFDSFDFREVAPSNITIDAFKKDKESSKKTGLSVAIPGEIKGFYQAHKEYGRLPWKDLFKEVIELSKEFKAPKILEVKLEKNKESILKDRGLRETYSKNGELIKEGDTVRRMNLSKTLKIISENPDSIYSGRLSKKIVDFINKNDGVFTPEDLKNYEVKKRTVLKGSFYQYDVYTTNIPTSGLFIIEALKILERINIRDMLYFVREENSYYLYHILIEIFKFISSERGRFGDPEYVPDWKKKVSEIISDYKAKQVFNKIRITEIYPEKEHSKVFFKEDHGTTHLNVIDRDEMVVSITSTINLEFGSKMMDPETGIIFNNHIDDFYIPGVDNAYGLPEMESNKLEGGKRPFSSASPTMLIKDDELLVIGAAGGTRIPTSIITTIAYFLAGNSIGDAIASCRIHNQLLPSITYIESSLPDFIIEKLKKMGHSIETSDLNTSFTSVQAIHMKKTDKNKKEIVAVSDYRKKGSSTGK